MKNVKSKVDNAMIDQAFSMARNYIEPWIRSQTMNAVRCQPIIIIRSIIIDAALGAE